MSATDRRTTPKIHAWYALECVCVCVGAIAGCCSNLITALWTLDRAALTPWVSKTGLIWPQRTCLLWTCDRSTTYTVQSLTLTVPVWVSEWVWVGVWVCERDACLCSETSLLCHILRPNHIYPSRNLEPEAFDTAADRWHRLTGSRGTRLFTAHLLYFCEGIDASNKFGVTASCR